jgi:hypothetical protein
LFGRLWFHKFDVRYRQGMPYACNGVDAADVGPLFWM